MPRTPRSSSGASVRLSQRLMPTMAMEVMAVMARGLLTLRLMPTMAMEDMADTVLATPLATGLATDTEVTERGPLILRPTPTTVMADMVDTDWVTVDTDW